MQVIRAIFDGREIKPVEPIRTKRETEVLVIFPNDNDKIAPDQARSILRGSCKGEKLTEKLLKARQEDLEFERS